MTECFVTTVAHVGQTQIFSNVLLPPWAWSDGGWLCFVIYTYRSTNNPQGILTCVASMIHQGATRVVVKLVCKALNFLFIARCQSTGDGVLPVGVQNVSWTIGPLLIKLSGSIHWVSPIKDGCHCQLNLASKNKCLYLRLVYFTILLSQNLVW